MTTERDTIPCAPPANPHLADIALAYFGLTVGLPATTNGKTTTTPPVVLPAEFTRTLHARAQLKGPK